jgi:integrase
MARSINKLKATALPHLRGPARYSDGAGLWLQISKTGAKSWLFQYAWNGRTRQMGLGSSNTISLAEARSLAGEARKAVLAGTDPIEARRERRKQQFAETNEAATFRKVAEQYVAQRKAGWKNRKHAAQWSSTLENFAYPVIGNLPVSRIQRAHILQILEPIWEAKPETAARLRARIENILDAAKARDLRTGDNPAAWRGQLGAILPHRKAIKQVKHHPALPFDEIPSFMTALRKRTSLAAKALEFTILTAARTNEVIGARWGEFDFDAKLWIIPGSRMKSGREHRLPLSKRALELLANIPREQGNPFVFIGGAGASHISNMAMLKLLKELRPALTVHGFRSTFRDWTSEQTSYPRDVAEMALAHTIQDKSEAAYRRGDLLLKRRRLMDDWAAFCLKTPVATNNVRQLQRHAKIGEAERKH